MSQQIINFFTSVNLTETTLPSTSQSNSPYTPSRCSPCNHDNNKKNYNIRKKRNQNPDRLKKENLTFKLFWQIGRPWLEYQTTDNKNFIFYTICQKVKDNSLWAISGCDIMKLEFVKRHENSVEHKNSLQILSLNQTGIKEGVNLILGMGMNNVVTQIRNIYFLSSQNITMNIYPDLASLVNYQKEYPTSLVSDIPLQVL